MSKLFNRIFLLIIGALIVGCSSAPPRSGPTGMAGSMQRTMDNYAVAANRCPSGMVRAGSIEMPYYIKKDERNETKTQTRSGTQTKRNKTGNEDAKTSRDRVSQSGIETTSERREAYGVAVRGTCVLK
jgi:H+/gluconate symporter-like permease